MALPLLLAGPIVRRARPDEVLVWLCTSQSIDLGVELYSVDGKRSSPTVNRGQPIGRGVALRRVRLGDKIFVHLLSAKPMGGSKSKSFPTHQLIAYDIKVLSTAGDWNTAGAGVSELGGTESLTLTKMPLPTFVLQDQKRNALRAIYSSCRKLHGKGADATRATVHLLESAAGDPSRRPNAMFLTGDQIYADDVAILLVEHIAELGAQLQGSDEKMPGLSGSARQIKPGGRQSLVNKTASFTSGEADNHLFTFGEFAATYLLAWNDHADIWPARYRGPLELFRMLPPETETGLFAFMGRYESERRELDDAKPGSGRLRRALANVATYMIFDDHEITDDWNLNDVWRRTAYAKPLARRIMANGLAAFWAFQAWGNAPEQFDKSFIDAVEQHFQALPASDKAFEDLMIDHRSWAFAAPTTPVAVFMDSRTRRLAARATYDMKHPRFLTNRVRDPLPIPRPPFPRSLRDLFPRTDGLPPHGSPDRLIDDAAAKKLRTMSARASGKLLVMIAPAPVFGLEMIEDAQNLLSRINGSYEFDLEHWHADPNSALELFEMLLRVAPSRCVLLSGDVHYGFIADVTITRSNKELKCVQFTSSATKNGTPTVMAGLGLIQTARELAARMSAFDFGRVTYKRSDGSTHIIELDEPAMLPVWQQAEAVAKSPGLREQVHFSNMGLDQAFNSVLAPNNVGLLWFDGNQTKHQLHYVRGGSVAATPLVSI